MLNTLDNLLGQVEQVCAGRGTYSIVSFGSDGDLKVYTPRKKEGSESRKVLFIGTGRCGTMYISQLFQENGIDIGHEVDGRDGISSHWFAYNSNWHPYVIGQPIGHIHLGEHRSDYFFEHTIHIVRNPLDCIVSIKSFFHDSDYEFLREQGIKNIQRNDLKSAMQIYYEVNRRCEEVAKTKPVQIETFADDVFDGICQMIFGTVFAIKKLKKANVSDHARLTWEDLHNEEPWLAYKLSRMAMDYGYFKDLEGTRYDVQNQQAILF